MSTQNTPTMKDGPAETLRSGDLVRAPKTNTLKYYLLERGHAYNENTLHAFDSAPERDAKTIEVIFGADLGNQDEAECWDKYREELNDTGSLEFEGDPGLEWFTAWPASCPNAPVRHEPKNGE